MRLVPTLVLTLAAALLGGVTAFAATPANGTLGTSVVIDVTDAGTKKPNVFLVDTATAKKYPMKVTAFSANSVTAEVTKAVVGTFDIMVDTKDGTDETQSGAFEVRAPASVSFGIAEGNPNTSVNATGLYFGSKKPKIFVGGKKAKVTAFTDSAITFLVPKKLANGSYDFVLENKIGSVTLGNSFTVTNSAVGMKPVNGKEFMAFNASGTAFRSGGPGISSSDAVVGTWQNLTNQLIVNCASAKLNGFTVTIQNLVLSAQVDLEEPTYPKTVPVFAFSYTKIVGAASTSYVNNGTGVTLTLDRYVGGRIQGTLSGSVPLSQGNGPNPINIGGGKFIVDVIVQ